MKNIKYANLYKNISFNLYPEDNINFEYTKSQVLEAFKYKYKKTIKRKLKNMGIELIGFEYYSPNYYNYENKQQYTNRIIYEDNLCRYWNIYKIIK